MTSTALNNQNRPCASSIQRLRMVKRTIYDNIGSDVEKIASMLEYSLGGGKGMRALVAHISCDWCALPKEKCNELAAAMEMIHVAALLHDDIVDSAKMRRDKPTLNVEFGSDAAVLAGDFLYSRASQLLCSAGNIALLQEVSDATNQLAEGEVMQLANKGSVVDIESYYDVIGRKTAALFSACAVSGPVTIGENDMRDALRTYGFNLGLAFQIIDDCLDYSYSSKRIGKTAGMDFCEGKTTLPLLYGLELSKSKVNKELKELFAKHDQDSFVKAQQILEDVKAIKKSKQDAQKHASKAIEALTSLPKCDFALMLEQLALKSINRAS